MDSVMTLVAAPLGRTLLGGLAAGLAAELPAAAPEWLAPDEACDLALGELDPAAALAAARRRIGAAAIDVVVQPVVGRRKRLLVADLESTMIENEMLDELADLLGLRAIVAAITRRAMNGEIDFEAALAERVALLQGMPVAALDEAARRIRPMPGARALVATMRRAGAVTALVSGGFTVFAEPVAATLGFDRVVANRLEIAGGRLAGRVTPPVVTRDTKRRTLEALAREAGIPPALTMAVGDGANDLAMLAAAGLGIAFRAKPAIAAATHARVDHGDLTAILYVQGYRRDEIVG